MGCELFKRLQSCITDARLVCIGLSFIDWLTSHVFRHKGQVHMKRQGSSMTSVTHRYCMHTGTLDLKAASSLSP